MKGDKPTKCFFDQFKSRKEHVPIKSFINTEGKEVFEIKEIINVAERYFQNLYSGQDNVQQNIINLFLERISPKESCILLMRALMYPITEQEIKDIIMAFKNNRAPGPDGLSIEFYKTMFPYIKNELIQLFNGYLRNGKILAETKSS